MISTDQFANYSAIQLATEAEFISWVKFPDADSNLFWNEYLRKYPLQFENVGKARAIVLQMHVVKDEMNENRADAVWNEIKNRISDGANEKGQRRVILMRWMAAAAVVLLVLSGWWFMVNRKTVNNPAVAVTSKSDDVAPGGDRAILTLADGKKVILDTANNGAITKQGNVTVIKLNNGQLAYAKQGSATEVVYNTITTPKGGQYQLVLADGSKVWLNAASSLRFPTAFVGKERRVQLTGEGYFEVTHDAEQPFHVEVNGMDVEDLGTHFNINSYSDEPSVKTTLLEGRVSVKNNGKLLYLNPGQQAIVQPDQDNIRIANNVDLDEVVAWKNGKFSFNSADIREIMRQAARWYDVDVVYQGKINETISGSLPRSENVSQLLKILEATGKVDFTINGRQIIVKPK